MVYAVQPDDISNNYMMINNIQIINDTIEFDAKYGIDAITNVDISFSAIYDDISGQVQLVKFIPDIDLSSLKISDSSIEKQTSADFLQKVVILLSKTTKDGIGYKNKVAKKAVVLNQSMIVCVKNDCECEDDCNCECEHDCEYEEDCHCECDYECINDNGNCINDNCCDVSDNDIVAYDIDSTTTNINMDISNVIDINIIFKSNDNSCNLVLYDKTYLKTKLERDVLRTIKNTKCTNISSDIDTYKHNLEKEAYSSNELLKDTAQKNKNNTCYIERASDGLNQIFSYVLY
jgi:hypothetical protein